VVEHLSAAFYELGIANALVKTDGDEIPILDGSALQFVTHILSVGICRQSQKRKILRVLKPVKVEDRGRYALLSPSDSFSIRVTCDFSARGLHTDPFSYDSRPFSDGFIIGIAPARTFGFFSDLEYLQKNSLAHGASMENTVVFDDSGHFMNENLRYDNEPVRHKILDAIGDLSLSQYDIVGHYDSFCPGHGINNDLLRELFKDSCNFEISE
jgi:UDP-3-O-[3-hydroxymyristoyl] N-acetylglucosamine deacetylase